MSRIIRVIFCGVTATQAFHEKRWFLSTKRSGSTTHCTIIVLLTTTRELNFSTNVTFSCIYKLYECTNYVLLRNGAVSSLRSNKSAWCYKNVHIVTTGNCHILVSLIERSEWFQRQRSGSDVGTGCHIILDHTSRQSGRSPGAQPHL
jgi:hypothetical protein